MIAPRTNATYAHPAALRGRSGSIALRVFLIALIAFTAFPPSMIAAQDEPSAPELGIIVSTPEVVVRSCASPSCDGIVLLRLGDTLHVTGPVEDGYFPVESAGRNGYVWSLFVATPSTGTPVLRRGSTGCNRIALIFNLGQGSFEDPFSWPMVDTLRNEGIAATMFIRSWWASYYPAWAYEFDQAGFAVGIHGEAGFSVQDQTPDDAMATILDTQSRLFEAMGRNPDTIFTPAESNTDAETLSMLAMAGYLPVIRSVNARDGHGSDVSAGTVAANILDGARDGAIIELHLDSPSGVNSTAAALPGVIATLRDEGYTFVTIPEMAQPCSTG